MGREYVLTPVGLGSATVPRRPEFAIQPTLEWAAARAVGLGAQRRNAPEARAAGALEREAPGAGLSKLHNVTDGRFELRLGMFDRPDSCGSGVWSREELCPF